MLTPVLRTRALLLSFGCSHPEQLSFFHRTPTLPRRRFAFSVSDKGQSVKFPPRFCWGFSPRSHNPHNPAQNRSARTPSWVFLMFDNPVSFHFPNHG